MKNLATILVASILAAAFCGCTSTHVKCEGDGKWEASIRSHWFAKDVDKLNVAVKEGGVFSVDLNGYKGDVSEQFPAWTREMWAGVGILARLAGAAYNPAVASVPLSADAASAADVEKLVKSVAAAKAEAAAAKAALVKAKAEAEANNAKPCADGACGE